MSGTVLQGLEIMTIAGDHPGTIICIPALYPRIVRQSIGTVGLG